MNRLFFNKYLAQTSTAPMAFEISKAEKWYLFDNQGNKFIDLIGGISVSSIGHSHPKVVDAVKKQAEQYMHVMVYGEAILGPQSQFAKLLIDQLPKHLDNVYFTNSGAEAVEGAMKLAKRFTGKTEIIACNNSYHGSTHGAMSIFGDESYRNAFRPLLPDITHINHNNISDLEKITSRTAAIIVEVIQAEGGCLVPDAYWLKMLRKKCNDTNTLLIFDEIQTGLGRTGKMWAFEHFGVEPDILLLGKALGGGMPIGAFIAPKHIMQSLANNPILGHMTTFGGHPVVCAAGKANMEVLLEENIIQDVERKGDLFKSLLVHPKIKKISGKGLMLAVQLESFEDIQKFINLSCLQYNKNAHNNIGIFTDWFLFAANSFRIVPPLTIDDDSIKLACQIIIKALNQL